MSLAGKTVLLTGGAGSLGTRLVSQLLTTDLKTLRIFDSDEYGLFLLKRQLKDEPRIRLLLGNVRDRDRVALAIREVDVVVHAAALKNVEVTEYNCPEVVRTNIDGTINLVELAIAGGVEKFLFVSSDKAVNSPTLYGSTKYVGERLVLWAARVSERAYSCVRMGNFLESRGNVFDLWAQQEARGEPLTLTHPRMMRYFTTTPDAAAFILKALETMKGGEVFVPKMEERSIIRMLKEMHPGKRWKVIGLRPGERMREELLTMSEMKRAQETQDQWIIRGA